MIVLRKAVLPFALLSIFVLLIGFAKHNSSAPIQLAPDSVPVRAEIGRIEGALPKIRDRGAALYLLAQRYAHLGDLQKALALLRQCVSLDEGFDLDSAAFQSLSPYHEFRLLVEQARRRHPPVHRAHVAFTIPAADLFPEGLAMDLAKHVFYMGSMHHKKIVRITEAGEVSDFVKEDQYALAPVGGIKVDPDDQSLWACTDGPELVHFDAHGKLLERFEVSEAGPHILNDLVLRNSEEIYLTDTRANQVYRFARNGHDFMNLTFSRPLFYPNGIALSGDRNLLYVADIFGVLAFDIRHNTAHEVDSGRGNTLAGIDGLYWYKNSLVAIQYGTGSRRIVHSRLSRDGLRVTKSEILEYRTDLVSFPTTGAIVREKFYFMANTGIGNLRDDKIVDPGRLEPVHIAVLSIDE